MSKRRVRSTSLFAIALAAVLFHALFQSRKTEETMEELTQRAQFVELEGQQKVRVRKMGQENLGFPIILESDLTGTSADWSWLQNELSQEFQVISYDRPGLGLSPDADMGRDGVSLAKNLDNVLRTANIKPPYILVGHSYGGLLMRLYRQLHPEKVAGILLVEPDHPEQEIRLPSDDVERRQEFFEKVQKAGYLSNFGLVSFAGLNGMGKGLPRFESDEVRTFFHSSKHLYAAYHEIEALPETNKQCANLDKLGEIPLGVVSATKPDDENMHMLQNLHEEISTASDKGFHVFVEGADHRSILWDKNHASVVANHVRTLMSLATANSSP